MPIDQDESWMNLSGSETRKSATGDRIIGQIFFATAERNLDQNDVDVLDGLARYMKAFLASTEGPYLHPFTIGFIGWADFRGAASYNQRLSQERADMVRAYFDDQFTGSGGTLYWRGRYNAISQGLGEGKARGSEIAQDRRVDITSNRRFKQVVEFEEKKIQGRISDTSLSRIFEFRVVFGYQIDVVPGLSFAATRIELRNPRSGKRIKLKMLGLGAGVGLPVGVSKPSDWQQVDVGVYMEVDDFEGRGEIISASGGVDSGTIYSFYGPNDYGRTPEYQRLLDKSVDIKANGPDLSVGVGSVPGFWERYE
jgi:outer membrane protein OmpA-like peptidoglycan-associated protein